MLDHFDGPQLFVGARTSLENARNGVFRSSRYVLKKIPSKNINFSQSYRFLEKCYFLFSKIWDGLDIDSFTSRDHSHISQLIHHDLVSEFLLASDIFSELCCFGGEIIGDGLLIYFSMRLNQYGTSSRWQ